MYNLFYLRFFFIIESHIGCRMQWLMLLPHTKRVTSKIPVQARWAFLCGVYMVLLCMYVASFQSTLASSHKNMLIRLISVSKLAVSVNMCVRGCLSLCVSPGIHWGTIQSTPCVSPGDSLDGLKTPETLNRISCRR